MKGRISKHLESILQSPRGRRELRIHLIRGEDGSVVVDGKTYRVQTEKRATQVIGKSVRQTAGA